MSEEEAIDYVLSGGHITNPLKNCPRIHSYSRSSMEIVLLHAPKDWNKYRYLIKMWFSYIGSLV
jgi:hypothetical protein